jgi:hypothetical protein
MAAMVPTAAQISVAALMLQGSMRKLRWSAGQSEMQQCHLYGRSVRERCAGAWMLVLPMAWWQSECGFSWRDCDSKYLRPMLSLLPR